MEDSGGDPGPITHRTANFWTEMWEMCRQIADVKSVIEAHDPLTNCKYGEQSAQYRARAASEVPKKKDSPIFVICLATSG